MPEPWLIMCVLDPSLFFILLRFRILSLNYDLKNIKYGEIEK